MPKQMINYDYAKTDEKFCIPSPSKKYTDPPKDRNPSKNSISDKSEKSERLPRAIKVGTFSAILPRNGPKLGKSAFLKINFLKINIL